jgi:septal ring factor EnvC (AmiA/AmiB activator)
VLFEEEIIKKSVRLLTDEENVNLAIEKIFVDLEKETKKLEEQKSKINSKKRIRLKTVRKKLDSNGKKNNEEV